MTAALRASGLTKDFARLRAVDGLDLEVPEGEVFGFLGPNGAGKTTTLRLLCALISPSAGTAEVAGFRLGRDDSRIRAAVGILTEQPGLYERLTALENLLFFAALYGLTPGTARGQAERYLRLMGLWDRRADAVATFSRGMKQKMAIARAVLHEPRLVFLDEPTTGLDPDAARTVRDFIVALRGEGRTVFLCTHNLDEADRLCDRIASSAAGSSGSTRPRTSARAYGGRLSSTSSGPRPEDSRAARVEGVREVFRENGVVVERRPAHEPRVAVLIDGGAEVAYVTDRRPTLEDVYLRIVEPETAPRSTTEARG